MKHLLDGNQRLAVGHVGNPAPAGRQCPRSGAGYGSSADSQHNCRIFGHFAGEQHSIPLWPKRHGLPVNLIAIAAMMKDFALDDFKCLSGFRVSDQNPFVLELLFNLLDGHFLFDHEAKIGLKGENKRQKSKPLMDAMDANRTKGLKDQKTKGPLGKADILRR